MLDVKDKKSKDMEVDGEKNELPSCTYTAL